MSLTSDDAKAILLEAADAIATEPGSLQLERWASNIHGEYAEDLAEAVEPHCGTPACIAGHIALAAKRRGVTAPESDGDSDTDAPYSDYLHLYIPVLAGYVLAAVGVESFRGTNFAGETGNAYDLFSSHSADWPEPWRTRSFTHGVPEAASEMLHHIATGGAL